MRLLGLDVGEKRIGVAKADSSVLIAVPVGMIPADGKEMLNIKRLVTTLNIDAVIVGMPRNLNGEETKQSAYVRNFVKTLNSTLLAARPNNKVIKIYLQDETLTSVEAKKNLKNKAGGINKKSGDVDAEAATLILQDFLENLVRRIKSRQSSSGAKTLTPAQIAAASASPSAPASSPSLQRSSLAQSAPSSPDSAASTKTPTSPEKKKPQFAPYKDNSAKKWLAVRVIIVFLVVVSLLAFGAKLAYAKMTSPLVSSSECSATSGDSDPCRLIEVTINDGSSVGEIASVLKSSSLIRSPFGFKLFNKLKGSASGLQAGTYQLSATLSVEEIVKKLQEGPGKGVVFRFTSLPGETLSDIEKRLVSTGYSEDEVKAAFSKNYDHPVLKSKPADASLEGYLFGETYEFYATDSVETIVVRMLDELYTVVQKNNLESKFNSMGLTLHEGIILASIVQKEAGTLDKEDQKTVAQVFLSRLNSGIPLGSDVTVKYALDLEDPNREKYTDNASALEIDSCYNTRKNAGLPCGPISNPGALVLISTANPSDTSYLYFLTGDDGLMYYSNTESEHNSAISAHCQELCNVSL